MTERCDHSMDAQITSKMHELIGCMCVVPFKQEGDRRGMIEGIESLILGNDFVDSFNRSQFKIHLTSGEIAIILGSAISEIESQSAGSDATTKAESRKRLKEAATNGTPSGKVLDKKARQARTTTMRVERRKANATKGSKATPKARTRKARERKKATP
jgi:hypothetical protein